GDVDPLAGPDDELREELVLAWFELGVGPDHQCVVAPDRAEHVRRLAANPRTEVAVVEAGNHLEPESHLAAPALHDPDQLAVGIEPPAAPQGDAVGDRGLRAPRTDV